MSKFKIAANCLILACAFAIPAKARTLIVSNTNDSGPGSLRQALADADDGDLIDATGISGVITLTTGQLVVGKSLTINGAGANVLTIDGNAMSRAFFIVLDEIVTISGFTIRNGHANTVGGGIDNEAGATVTVLNCNINSNSANLGSGLFNAGVFVIANSTLSSNMATEGGATYNDGSGTLTITNSTVSRNVALVAGGANFNLGTMQIANSTFSNNAAKLGAIHNEVALEIGNTILDGTGTEDRIFDNSGTVTSDGFNVCSDDGGGFLTGPGDQINTDPLLGPLQANGGPTFTHELLVGSPAIDAGDPGFSPPPVFDQRGPGFDRVRNGRIDTGSFEVQVGPTPTATPAPTPGATPTATPSSTPTATPVATPSPTAIPTVTPTPTATPRQSPTPRAMPTPRHRVVPHPRPTPPR